MRVVFAWYYKDMQGQEKLYNISIPFILRSFHDLNWNEQKRVKDTSTLGGKINVNVYKKRSYLQFQQETIALLQKYRIEHNESSSYQPHSGKKIEQLIQLIRMSQKFFRRLAQVSSICFIDHSVHFNRWNTIITCLWKWSYSATL